MAGTIFTQSLGWLNLQKALGRKCWFIEEENLTGLVIKYDLPLNKGYLYCPYGPVTKDETKSIADGLKLFLDKIQKISVEENIIFLRCDPQSELFLEKYGFRKAPLNYYFSATAMPQSSAILDIRLDEQSLLNNMKPKTRYNIHLAEQKGVSVEQIRGDEGFSVFYNLVCQTAKRERIKPHPKEHYKKLLAVFGQDISIFIAFYQNRPVAAIMILFLGDTTTYLHGGSDLGYKAIMAPHLLHWRAIVEAKKRGCGRYDFGGISVDSNSFWAGITRFKLSFGAKAVQYPGAYDLVFQPFWYQLYNFVRQIKKH